MREISTEDLKVGEHIIVDGVEYVAKEYDGDCCIVGCGLSNCGHCHLIPCIGEIILKRVEKQPTEEEGMQDCMNCAHLKKEKGRPVWNCELMERARATDEDGEFFCEDYEAL